MKRIFGLICVIAVLLAAIALPASAAAYTRTFSHEFTTDYYVNVGDSNGDVEFAYFSSFYGAPDFITTMEEVPSGGTGWVFSYITRQYKDELEAYSSQDTSISNNLLECTVGLKNYLQATKSNHFASRTYNGTSNSWDYYYVSQYHGDGVDYESLSDSVLWMLSGDSK